MSCEAEQPATINARSAIQAVCSAGLTADIARIAASMHNWMNNAQPRRRPRRSNNGSRMRSISGDHIHLKP